MKLSVRAVSLRVAVFFVVVGGWLIRGDTIALGRDYYVHPSEGDDQRDGLSAKVTAKSGPVKTIACALKLAEAGDTVHLANTPSPYREPIVLHDRNGRPHHPIVLDGHGATITGAERVHLKDWDNPQPGLYCNSKLLKADKETADRWFFRMDGRMNRMNCTSKGPSDPLKPVADLQRGDWTFLPDESCFYIKFNPDDVLDEMIIEAPVRSVGVQISGNSSHLVVRNLTVTHFHDDGFNLRGKCREVAFENVRAIECGDDGLSAQDDCHIHVEGFDSVGNDTGFYHSGSSRSYTNRAFISDSLAYDFLVRDSGHHRLVNALIYSSGEQAIRVEGDQDQNEFCTLEMSHVAVSRVSQSPCIQFAENSDVHADHCTFAGFHLQNTGRSLSMHRCVVAGSTLGKCAKPEMQFAVHVKWTGDHNVYDIAQLSFEKTSYPIEKFAVYQSVRRQGFNSRPASVRFAEPFNGFVVEPRMLFDVGASHFRLPRPLWARLGPRNDFVHGQIGDLPLIISAPHGGRLPIPNVNERKGEELASGVGGFTNVRDLNTEELAHTLANDIERRWGKKPYFVIARWHRRFLDVNRPPRVAYEDFDAKPVYDAYHSALTDACRAVKARFGKGLLLDIHGQGVAKDTVFRGTQNGKTVSLLKERFGDAAHHGPTSLFGDLRNHGWKVQPQTLNGPEHGSFMGGFIVQTYGSHQGFGIDAMQLEFGPDYTRDQETRERTSGTLTTALGAYADRYLDLKLVERTSSGR